MGGRGHQGGEDRIKERKIKGRSFSSYRQLRIEKGKEEWEARGKKKPHTRDQEEKKSRERRRGGFESRSQAYLKE